MADDKIKQLGQSAATIPLALKERIELLQKLGDGLQQVFTDDAYLSADIQSRFEKVEGQIRSFNDDVETEFEELHTITEKLLSRVDECAEDTSEGARRVGLELDNLAKEVVALDNAMTSEIAAVDTTLQDLTRLHEEMEGVSQKRLPIVLETLAELESKSIDGKKVTSEFNSDANALFLKMQQECEKQKFRMEDEFGKWPDKIVLEMLELFVVNEILEALQEADARVIELLSGVDSFFQQDVIEPANQKASSLSDKLQLFNEKTNSATTESKDARAWVEPTLQEIAEHTRPLDDMLSRAQGLKSMFS